MNKMYAVMINKSYVPFHIMKIWKVPLRIGRLREEPQEVRHLTHGKLIYKGREQLLRRWRQEPQQVRHQTHSRLISKNRAQQLRRWRQEL